MAATILIVEDNELNMELFADLLEGEGYRVLKSADGLDGFRQARERRPDLIVMDIQLPTVSGLEVTRWLKEEPDLAGIPVLAVTAFAMKGDETRMLEGGCQAYMAKPISVGRFLDTIRTLLAGRDQKPI
ncbi:MAG TPA: response regulator [Caulobacteraceae bacterium]|jgi:two-component system cell cycle response regulator DivK|nr:response regulator [Caulobacteraceae bacterium]